MTRVNIQINGETRGLPDSLSLRDIIKLLELAEDRVAVELNREIVKRHRWAETQLHEGDRMEIVHFIGGG